MTPRAPARRRRAGPGRRLGTALLAAASATHRQNTRPDQLHETALPTATSATHRPNTQPDQRPGTVLLAAMSATHRRNTRLGRRSRPLLVLLLAAVSVAALVACLGLTPAPPVATRPVSLAVASIPYWNFGPGTAAVLANRQDVNEVSPWMYGLSADGIVDLFPAGQAAEISADLARLTTAGLPIVPTIANTTASGFAYQPIADIMHDSARTARHIAAITALVAAKGYAGIDIDYEELAATDRAAFGNYIQRLGAALHAEHKILSVALFAKATDAGYDQRNVAQDYAAIGRAADQVRLMGYDYHWESSPPGPVAPITWIDDVLAYATSQIAPAKIVLGVPCYGYDWVGTRGTSLTWAQATALASARKVPIMVDKASRSPWFAYTDNAGRRHQVWFEDATSAAVKFTAVAGTGVGGVFLWMYGNPDPAIWGALHGTLPPSRPAAVWGDGANR